MTTSSKTPRQLEEMAADVMDAMNAIHSEMTSHRINPMDYVDEELADEEVRQISRTIDRLDDLYDLTRRVSRAIIMRQEELATIARFNHDRHFRP